MSTDDRVTRDDIDLVMKRLAEANKRITNLEETVEDLRNGNDGPDALEKVVAHADRKTNGDDCVVLDYNEVMAAADVSHQTAYNYMDKLAENTDFASLNPSPDGLKRIEINTALSNGFRTE